MTSWLKKKLNIPSYTNKIWKKRLASLKFNCMKGNWRPRKLFLFKTNIDTIPLKDYFSLKWTSARGLCQALFSVSLSIKDTHTIINSVLNVNRIRRNQSFYSHIGHRDNKHHHWIQRIWIRLRIKFQLNRKIWIFGPNFPKKGVYRLKQKKWTSPSDLPYPNDTWCQILADTNNFHIFVWNLPKKSISSLKLK